MQTYSSPPTGCLPIVHRGRQLLAPTFESPERNTSRSLDVSSVYFTGHREQNSSRAARQASRAARQAPKPSCAQRVCLESLLAGLLEIQEISSLTVCSTPLFPLTPAPTSGQPLVRLVGAPQHCRRSWRRDIHQSLCVPPPRAARSEAESPSCLRPGRLAWARRSGFVGRIVDPPSILASC